MERPLVVFWGVIDRRMDLAWIRTLATSMTAGTILLVGPLADPDPDLLTTPRVVHHPPIDYADLPRLAAGASVLVMPYADLPVTRAMQPLKLKEYLATGLPTVVRDLPANREWADAADLATNAGEFARLVWLRLTEGLPAEQRTARLRLEREGWEAKARRFAEWVL